MEEIGLGGTSVDMKVSTERHMFYQVELFIID